MARALLLAVAMVLAWPCLCAPDPDVLSTIDFEATTPGMLTLDPLAELSITRDPTLACTGKRCLTLAYRQRPQSATDDMPGSALLSLAPHASALIRGISFSVWTQRSLPLLVRLFSKGPDAQHDVEVWCEADEWCEVTLGLDEFEPVDTMSAAPQPKLVPEAIVGLAFVDAGCVLSALGMTAADPRGTSERQTLRIDDIKLLAAVELPKPVRCRSDRVIVCDYEPPVRNLALIGGEPRRLLATQAPLGKAARIDYSIEPDEPMIIAHSVGQGDLSGAREFRLRAMSDRPTDLLLALQEGAPGADGPVYGAPITLAASDQWQDIAVPVTALQLAEDGFDANDTLDVDRVRMLYLIDLSSRDVVGALQGSLRLDDLVAIKVLADQQPRPAVFAPKSTP